jgi:hypothetical protein
VPLPNHATMATTLPKVSTATAPSVPRFIGGIDLASQPDRCLA